MADLAALLPEIAAAMARESERGRVATYIPQLAKVDPERFGIAVVETDGTIHVAGDADEPFSIQSISKVFTLTLAVGRVGDALWRRVGREPSGNPFNSITQLEAEHGVPRNPFINAGALVVTDVVLSGYEPRGAIGAILSFVRFLAEADGDAAGDRTIVVDEAVARSETATGYRNVALANYMKAFGNIENPPEKTLGVYFHQCAIAMSCRQLALAGRYLAHAGLHPPTGRRVISAERARRINALMLTCGHYDGSGDFAFRVGIPGKSGVGGGILAIVPGRAAIAVWSPGLNEVGNSRLGSLALERLAKAMGWSVFGG